MIKEDSDTAGKNRMSASEKYTFSTACLKKSGELFSDVSKSLSAPFRIIPEFIKRTGVRGKGIEFGNGKTGRPNIRLRKS